MATPITQEKRFDEYVSLCDAIQRKDKGAARQHILNNVPVNPTTREPSNTPLHWAILNFSDTEIVKMLLDKGADITLRNQFDETPLYLAVNSNKLNVIKLLLNKGVYTGEDFSILIAKATEVGNQKMMETLVEHEIQANRPINLNSAVDIAAQNGYAHILQFLLTYHKVEDTDKWIPKSLVFKNGIRYKKCIDLFLQHGYTINPKDKNDFHVIYYAVENGYLVLVEEFLKLGINVNKIYNTTGLTLLHLACMKKNADIAELLIEYKANMSSRIGKKIRNHPNVKGLDVKKLVGRTALSIAVCNLDGQITELLLARGADINEEPDLLIFALTMSSLHIVEILLMFGLDVNKVDRLGITPLHFCIVTDLESFETDTLYLSNDFEHEIDFYNNNIFEYISDFDSEDEEGNLNNKDKIDVANMLASTVELLLSYGANVNAQTYTKKMTPLHCAIRVPNPKIVEILLKYNADTTLTDSKDLTPLHYLGISHFPCDVFLKHDVDINVKNSLGMTPLHLACVGSRKKPIDKLLENSAKVNCVNFKQETPLHLACRIHQFEIIQILLGYQANVNAKDERNRTPFHFLFESTEFIPGSSYLKSIHFDKLKEICKSFIELNADINAADSEGKTPLFYACSAGDEETVITLVKHEADVNAQDLLGKTPLHIVASLGPKNFNIMKILLANNADASIVDKNGNTILHAAVLANNTFIFEVLDELHINIINIKNNEGKTALHMATSHQTKNMVRDLLHRDADINIMNADDKTALHLANNGFLSARNELEHAQDNNDDWIYKDLQKDIDAYEEIINCFHRHVLKLETAQLYVKKEILELIHGNELMSQLKSSKAITFIELVFKQRCIREIEMLKKENIGDTILYNLLTDDINFLSKLEGSKNILEVLQSGKYDRKFLLYINIIKSRFKKAIAQKND